MEYYMTVEHIIKELKDIESRRFSVQSIGDNSVTIEGFSLGYQGDYMYTKFKSVVTIGDSYSIKHSSDLYVKDKSSKELYSTYNIVDHREGNIVVNSLEKLLHFFTNENLATIARQTHDWDIEIVYD